MRVMKIGDRDGNLGETCYLCAGEKMHANNNTQKGIMKNPNIRNVVFAVLMGVFVTHGVADAATFTPPTYEQVGVTYAYYVMSAFDSSHDASLPSGTALQAILPFGTNAGYWAYFNASANEQSNPYWNQAATDANYYQWLGYMHAYENYMYPEYAAQLLNYYISVAEYVWTSESATAQWVEDYYDSIANYYYGLIYPADTLASGTSDSLKISGANTAVNIAVSGGTLQIGSGTLLQGGGTYSGNTTITGGTLVLSGNNTYTGNTTATSGTLQIGSGTLTMNSTGSGN
jgi:autotransporter-associated beta strand protein